MDEKGFFVVVAVVDLLLTYDRYDLDIQPQVGINRKVKTQIL